MYKLSGKKNYPLSFKVLLAGLIMIFTWDRVVGGEIKV